MRDSWRHYLRRIASVGIVAGATTWSSAVCYAVQLASDTAANAAYNDGWQEGDNGGFGFGPWSFDGTVTNNPVPGEPDLPDDGNQQAMDDGLKTGTQTSSTFNDVGRAWTMFNNKGKNVGTANGATGTELAQAGRSMPALQVGQTLSVVLDNPIQRFFFRGYNLKLNIGDNANICYLGDNCSTPEYDPGSVTTNWVVQTFQYDLPGQWYWPDDTFPLHDMDTDTGVRIDFTLTAADAFSFTMTPLDNPGIAATKTGTLGSSDQLDWINFQFYNTDSDFYPTMLASPASTDFYIRSLAITGAAPPGVAGDYNGNGVVDGADYVVYRNNLGTNFQLSNEVSGTTPGQVTPEDYAAWRARFGNTSGAGSGLSGSGVPEPSTFVFLVAGGMGAVSLGLRRKPKNG